MKKETLKEILEWSSGVLMSIIVLSFIGFVLYTAVQDKILCKKGEIEHCSYADCYFSCEKLEMEYLKQDTSGFGSGECWCHKDNEPKQIY